MTEKDLELERIEKLENIIEPAMTYNPETMDFSEERNKAVSAILTYIRQEEVKLLGRLIAKGSCYHGQSAIQMVNIIQQEIDRIKGE
jgi:hypothetical protein